MFKSRLHYKALIKGELWQLESALIYEFVQRDYHGEYLKNHRIIVPSGYVTDFYSIPKPLRPIWPNDIDPPHPAVIHDYIFTHLNKSYSRRHADKIFLLAMEEMRVPKLRRNLFYAAVRLGGEAAWRRRIKKREMMLRGLGIDRLINGQPL